MEPPRRRDRKDGPAPPAPRAPRVDRRQLRYILHICTEDIPIAVIGPARNIAQGTTRGVLTRARRWPVFLGKTVESRALSRNTAIRVVPCGSVTWRQSGWPRRPQQPVTAPRLAPPAAPRAPPAPPRLAPPATACSTSRAATRPRPRRPGQHAAPGGEPAFPADDSSSNPGWWAILCGGKKLATNNVLVAIPPAGRHNLA